MSGESARVAALSLVLVNGVDVMAQDRNVREEAITLGVEMDEDHREALMRRGDFTQPASDPHV